MKGKSLSPAEVDFWLDTEKYSDLFDFSEDGEEKSLVFNIDMVRLSSIRKAVSNFVRILTRKNIPVYFNDGGANVNFGGKTIYLSAKINNKLDFDVAVGQALHEGAHTLKTDFDIIKIAWANIPPKILKLSDAKNIRRSSLEKFIHTMWNVIEDRYIDNYVFNEAPGYRGYYVALYDRFWHNPKIDEYLVSDLFRHPSLDSYNFRITNLTNENTDLTALPRLDDVAREIDLSNIGRLKKTKDRVKTAFNVVEIVLNALDIQPTANPGGSGEGGKDGDKPDLADPSDYFDFGDKPTEADPTPDKSKKPEKEEKGDPSDSDGDASGDSEDGEGVDVGKKMVNEISDILSGRNGSPETLPENSDAVNKISEDEVDKEVEKSIKGVLESQRKFLSGEIPKEVVTSQQKSLLDLIEKHGIILVQVELPTIMSGDDKNLKVDCIVVQEMTKELIFSGQAVFPLSGAMKIGIGEPDPPTNVADAVKKGILLGTKLGRKLQIRAESNPIKTIRKKYGKINKRLLHEAACDIEDLFYKIKVEEHNDATLHISVDASSSMNGNKWFATMTSVVAICKAASMIDNVHITVSFRATQMSGSSMLPYIVLAYDSKKDKFSKVKRLFPYLVPNGATPEGLAFSAIMNLFEGITPDEEERYFLNLSDGEPCYYAPIQGTNNGISYDREVGGTHTKAQVDKIRRNGIEVLSYFIAENPYAIKKHRKDMTDNEITTALAESKRMETDPLRKNFYRMYGKSAKFIDVESVVDLARTINGLFLSRKQ